MRSAANIGRLLSDTARLYPDRTALIHGDRRWSWAELDRRANALRDALAGLGVQPGEPVLTQARNCRQLIETLWGVFKLGAVWVPANFRLTPPETAYLAADSGASAMLYGPGFAEQAAASGIALRIAYEAPGEGELDYEALLAGCAEPAAWEADVGYDDPAWLFYTSGTTGRPKGATLCHGQLAFVVANRLADIVPGTGPEDVALVLAPLSHGAGTLHLCHVARGAASVLPEAPGLDPAEVWRLIQRHRVSQVFTVPTILRRLCEHPAAAAADRSSLRHVVYTGEPIARADQRLALRVLGRVLVQYYGLGEVTGSITRLAPDMHSLADDDPLAPPGSCGIARTGMEIGIFDAGERRLAAGEVGEVRVRGPAVFSGYWRNPEADRKAFRGGWFCTGDLGRLDMRGFLFLTGRANDMYISGGTNVYPREVEETLLQHPELRQAAVFGVPDPEWGEIGVAVVVPRPGSSPDLAEVMRFLGGRLSRYKQPRRIFLWEALPESGAGKIAKLAIRDELIRRGDLAPPAGEAQRP